MTRYTAQSSVQFSKAAAEWRSRVAAVHFFYLFMDSFSVVLNLHRCVGFALVEASGAYSVVAVHGLLIAVASLVAEHRL